MAIRDRNGALHSEKNGRFVSKGDSDNVGFDVEKLEKQSRGQPASIMPGKGEPVEKDMIRLPFETLPRSVGAKWANHKIRLPNGQEAKFVEGSRIRERTVFAGKGCRRKIDEVDRLIKDYPGTKASQWQKVKGIGEIELQNGTIQTAELHWYEEPTVGKVEIKKKKCR